MDSNSKSSASATDPFQPASAAFGDGVYERLQTIRRTWDPDERFLASHRIATR